MSQDGKILVSGSAGKTIKIWHLNPGLDENYRVIPHAHLSDVLSLASKFLSVGEKIALLNSGI